MAVDASSARHSRPIWPDLDDAVGQPIRINTRKIQKVLNSFSLTPLLSFGKQLRKFRITGLL
jgi:hypothetical protein